MKLLAMFFVLVLAIGMVSCKEKETENVSSNNIEIATDSVPVEIFENISSSVGVDAWIDSDQALTTAEQSTTKSNSKYSYTSTASNSTSSDANSIKSGNQSLEIVSTYSSEGSKNVSATESSNKWIAGDW